MSIEVRVPDIGDFKDVPVIELLVKAGDQIKKDDPLVTLESEKATFEVPSPSAGTVKELKVKVGDKVAQGSALVTLDEAAAEQPATAAPPDDQTPEDNVDEGEEVMEGPAPAPQASKSASIVELRVPDIGDFTDIPVIEVLVKAGDRIEKDASVVTLESDKATMEIPATAAGTIEKIALKVGDKVSKGSLIGTLASSGPEAMLREPQHDKVQKGQDDRGSMLRQAQHDTGAAQHDTGAAQHDKLQAQRDSGVTLSQSKGSVNRDFMLRQAQHDTGAAQHDTGAAQGDSVHASPSIRRFARELGVDMQAVKGSGPSGRITREDVQRYVKTALQTGASGSATGAGLNLAPWPKIDFAQYGPVESKPLSRIKKLSGPYLHRNWVMIPHVTNNEDADVTDLESFRKHLNEENAKSGTKVTMLAFLIKAVVAALQNFPDFNSSLDGDNLVLKKYYNIGFAADTPNGLIVPVIKDADKKGVLAIAHETAELSAKGRDGKIGPADLAGGTFTISSLGGIGGTYFTPIINAPEVAILGACRAAMRPVWDGKAFVPRLMLPLSLSYDHRVIDGAAAARFNVFLANVLADMRRAML